MRNQIHQGLHVLRGKQEEAAEGRGDATAQEHLDGTALDYHLPEQVDKHSLLLYDLQVLYIPAVDILEQFLFNEAR